MFLAIKNGQHEEPGQVLRTWSGPNTGASRRSERICGTHPVSNMYADTTELYLSGFMNFHWLSNVFVHNEAGFGSQALEVITPTVLKKSE